MLKRSTPAVRMIGLVAFAAASGTASRWHACCEDSDSANGAKDADGDVDETSATPLDHLQSKLNKAGIPLDVKVNMINSFECLMNQRE